MEKFVKNIRKIEKAPRKRHRRDWVGETGES